MKCWGEVPAPTGVGLRSRSHRICILVDDARGRHPHHHMGEVVSRPLQLHGKYNGFQGPNMAQWTSGPQSWMNVHMDASCKYKLCCVWISLFSFTRTKGGSAASRHVSNELLMNFLGAQIKPAEHLSVALTGPGCQFSCRNASRPLYAGAGAGARAGPPGPLGREDHRNHRIIQPSLVQAQSDPVPGFENRSEALQYMGFNIV